MEDWKLKLALEFSIIQFNTLPWRVCQLPYSFDMDCQDEPLVQKVCELYEQISSLESLKPSKDVDTIFTKLVLTCMPPNPIDESKLCKKVQEMKTHLTISIFFLTILIISNLASLNSISFPNTTPMSLAKLPLWAQVPFLLPQLSWPPNTLPMPPFISMILTL